MGRMNLPNVSSKKNNYTILGVERIHPTRVVYLNFLDEMSKKNKHTN
eukprot:NODE_4193_length_328_cov_99.928315_g4111_i0.p1 GENE.NODE_4193_length_328_cov_99.928315_g4111_i0~~NODE_4193_length_328_cov_99.928315_g4111_i0.p1  ORF type:complete len:54 (-),score=13.18 NODE_4193_length_328_cov_99.928315_g4111_i0:165-305(-)